jgi:5'-3' exonuclease
MSIFINNSKPVILIDQSYYIFNRYFASLSWFRKQFDESELDFNNLTKNDEFILAFFRHFENDVKKLTKKYKTIKSNIILCNDCNRSEIWRNEIYKEYKEGRGKKSNFDSQIFILFKNYISHNAYNYCELDNLEADDIVYLLQEKIKEEIIDGRIIIITNDNDYLQMYNDRVSIINMQFKDLSLRIKHNPIYELEYKIIFGDKSDNIPKIHMGMRSDFALKLAMMNEENRNKYLIENNLMNKYLFNKRLVDLREIPVILVNKFNDKYNIIIKK